MSQSSDSSRPLLPTLDRRRFLRYVGTGAAALAGTQLGLFPLGCAPGGQRVGWVDSNGKPDWIAPPYPIPLPGEDPTTNYATRLAQYTVQDELVLPEGFRYDVVAGWGDRFGAAGHEVRFGYNCDYTGLAPIEGSDDEFWLMVNHEYVSPRPWSEGYAGEEDGFELPEMRLERDPENPDLFKYGRFTFAGWTLPVAIDRRLAEDDKDLRSQLARQGNSIDLETRSEEIPPEIRAQIEDLCERGLAELGVSILRVRRLADGRFEVVSDATDHRRIMGKSCQNVSDATHSEFGFTGPAAALLGDSLKGTICNCSGGTTPWGTFLTCEENFQYEVNEEITPAGRLLEGRKRTFRGGAEKVNGVYDLDTHPVPSNLDGLGLGIAEPLDGRHYGWVGEIEPETGRLTKHTGLGRFRHENVTLRCEAGKPMAAYMGDDRRGGHVWKFVSEGTVEDPKSRANSRLLEKGTLYVARFEEGMTGRWLAIEPSTPLRRPEIEHLPTEHIQLPARPEGDSADVGNTEGKNPDITVEEWVQSIETFTGKSFDQCTLADLVSPPGDLTEEQAIEYIRGVLVTDAFLMANAIGGTPSARPEDLEVHPIDQSVYIAFTDATDGSDGAPDARIFPDSRQENSRQYGAIYRIVEGEDGPASETFTWGHFVSSGEVAERGGGFACADNLAFDPDGNLWMVTDISTSAQNFPTTRSTDDGTQPGGKQFRGIFGNNALFMIPTSGEDAGIPRLFAIGPMECEMCGPTFTDDGRTLILSVQHPGETHGTRRADQPDEEQIHLVFDPEGKAIEQRRTVPRGSNFPHGELGRAPQPAVVCITRDTTKTA